MRSHHHHCPSDTAPMRRLLRTVSESRKIINSGNFPGTFPDGIPLAGTSMALWLLSEPSACARQGALQGRRPSHCWCHHHCLDHLRAKGAGTCITPCTLHYPLCPGSIRYDVADEGEGQGDYLRSWEFLEEGSRSYRVPLHS